MGEIKELNIKNWRYYYFDDMIDIRNFHSNLLKTNKKSHRDFDICYIGYNRSLVIVIVIVIVIIKIFVAWSRCI